MDEAHHLHWSESGSSLEYDLIQALATEALGVLLLTATPEQCRPGHFGRLRLLDPQRYQDYQQFLEQEKGYQAVAEIASNLMDDLPLNLQQEQMLASLLADVPDMDALPTADIIELLVDRHGTGRVLYRNTRSAISGFPGRELRLRPWTCRFNMNHCQYQPMSCLRPNRWSAVTGPGSILGSSAW